MGKKPILLTTHHEAFLHKGDDEYEMFECALNLREMGFIADIYSPFARSVDAYDIIMHFSLHQSGLCLVETLSTYGKKIILRPNFSPTDRINEDNIKTISRYMDLCDAIVFKSHVEYSIIQHVLPKNCDILFMYPGVDPCFAAPAPKHLFRDTYGLEEYILWTGSIGEVNNQLFTIQALAELSCPLVLIGTSHDKAYYDACRRAAPEHFIFLDALPHKSDLMRSAMQECRLYIEPSPAPSEKSATEAAISGAALLLADSDWARECFGDIPIYVDPYSRASIASGVQKGLALPRCPERAGGLAATRLFPHVLHPLCEYLERS